MKTIDKLLISCHYIWKLVFAKFEQVYRSLSSYLYAFKSRARSCFSPLGRRRKCFMWGILACIFLLASFSLLRQGNVPSDSDLARAIANFTDSQDSPLIVCVRVTSYNGGGVPAVKCKESVGGWLRGNTKRMYRRNSTSVGSRQQLQDCHNVKLNLVGRFTPDLNPMSPHQIAALFPEVRDGGHFVPQACQPSEKTAILMPYMDRWENLHTVLSVLFEMLRRQNVDFTIYVIEQMHGARFNKGLMFNAGFLEAMKLEKYDCIILHDVDMVPIDDRNIYRCNKTSPLHFSSSVDKFNYSTLYSGLFGGVTSFTADQFREVNGFSNLYFGWGAEDDDLRDRALYKNFTLYNKPASIGAYNMIKHSGEKNWEENYDRFKIYRLRYERIDFDGLNSAPYRVLGIGYLPIYTWLAIQINEEEVVNSIPEYLRPDNSSTKNGGEYARPAIPELPG